jgi:hypothetical protein
LYAAVYLAKKALCYASLLETKLNNKESPFDCDKAAWTNFTNSKDYKDASQFVSSVRNNVYGFFTMVYKQFCTSIGKFSQEDQEQMLKLVSVHPQ